MTPDVQERQDMQDLVILIPGITGSVLSVNGSVVWGLSGQAILRGLVTLGASVNALKLRDDGTEDPRYEVKATALMPDVHVIPGMWSPIKGYSGLTSMLRNRFMLTPSTSYHPDNFLEFPYDWRLSNAISGQRLADVAVPALERWRKGHKEAKLILICHSMGGLVARWFLEVLGGAELTRRLITIATPYEGAVNAIDALANGLSVGGGTLEDDITSLARSLPSLYELLPTYECVDRGAGNFAKLSQESCGLDVTRLAAAAAFHRRITDAATKRAGAGYEILAVKGIDQPTYQSVQLTSGRVVPLRTYNGNNLSGDGTVPRPSAEPPEWKTGQPGPMMFAAQRHGSIQESDGVLTQLFGYLSRRADKWMGAPGVERLGLDLPPLIVVGETLTVAVTANDSTLALSASVTLHGERAPRAISELLVNEGGGRYHARFAGLPPGLYDVAVTSADSDRPVEPVSDVTIVWDPNVA